MIEESQESYIASIFKPVLEHQEEMAESMINKQQN